MLPVAVELNSLVWFGTVWLSCGIDLVWFVGKGLIYNGLRLIWFGCFCTLLVYYGWFVLFDCGLDDLVSFQLIDLFAYFFVNAYGLDGFLAVRVCFAYTVNIFAMCS